MEHRGPAGSAQTYPRFVDYTPQTVGLRGILSGLTLAFTLLASAIWLRASCK